MSRWAILHNLSLHLNLIYSDEYRWAKFLR
jgi:hypothetical protein